MGWYFVGAISSKQSNTLKPLIRIEFLLLMNNYSPDIYDYILKEYEATNHLKSSRVINTLFFMISSLM